MNLETELLIQAAELAGDRGQWADAARLYQELAASRPGDVSALLRLGGAQREAGQQGAAETTYARALELDPGEPEVLRALGRLALQAGRAAEALAFHRSALSRAAGDAALAKEVRQLEAAVPASLTPELSGRLILARRALTREDRAAAAEHYRAVLAAAPALAELRQRLAECISAQAAPPPGGQRGLEVALDDAARPWITIPDAAGVPRMPPALLESGPVAWPALPDAYMGPDCRAALDALQPGFPGQLAAEAALGREARLRELAGAGDTANEAAALLPNLLLPQPTVAQAGARARAEASAYFAPEAAWFRYLLRDAVRTGQPLPAARDLPLELLRFEPDLLYALAGTRDAGLLLRLPVTTEGGAVLYRIVDLCLQHRDTTLGVPMAQAGETLFQRQGDSFKSLEFSFKAGNLLESLGEAGLAAAQERYGRVLSESGDIGLIVIVLQRALTLVPAAEADDGPTGDGPTLATIRRRLAARGEATIAAALALLLHQSSGTGDPLQRRATRLLTLELTRFTQSAIPMPALALDAPALFGHMLRHGVDRLPQGRDLRPAAQRIAAFASGFTDIGATGQHLTDLLGQGDHDGIAAIDAYITRRYGEAYRRGDGQGITTILSTRNVGDTLLYLAGFAAFVLASGRSVHVLHRQERTMLRDFFGAVPGLTFEAIPNDVEIPLPLGLNRLATGNVSLFYENPWYHRHEAPRLADRSRERNFLWHKLITVLLSGAAFLPERIAVERPPLYPPAAWNEAARHRFAEMGLKRGRTVFLSPLANTLFRLTPSRFNHFRDVWMQAITLFRQAGFTVVTNATNNHAAETLFPGAGVPELNLDLREMPAFVAECGYFAGVRSGLCDLLALCGLEGVRSRTIYMRDGEHCIGLADFGMSEVVADFQAHAPRDLAASLFADWLGSP